MIVVNLREAKTRLSALLAAVEERGETVIICRHGRPVAELRAVGSTVVFPDPLQTHPELKARILYDPTEPATEDEWPSECR
jgi:antitoxin (DNA-binding transcriptional repressor) of toxin-antitoxin stability system